MVIGFSYIHDIESLKKYIGDQRIVKMAISYYSHHIYHVSDFDSPVITFAIQVVDLTKIKKERYVPCFIFVKSTTSSRSKYNHFLA